MKFFVTFDTSTRNLYVLFDQLDKSILFIYPLSSDISRFCRIHRDRHDEIIPGFVRDWKLFRIGPLAWYFASFKFHDGQ